MENITYPKTEKTPEVIIDYSTNTISITGICVPEDPKMFFDPIVKQILNFKLTKSELLFNVYLEYFNTGASKCLLNLFLEAASKENEFKHVEVNWIIDEGDAELREAGEVFEEITKLKFNYKEVSSN